MRDRLFTNLTFFCLFIAIGLVTDSKHSAADEWRGWMGNDRDGVYRETGVIDQIPEDGLEIKWRTPVEGGYAGPAVSDGKVFVFDYVKASGSAFNHPTSRVSLSGNERLMALDQQTGEPIWEHTYECVYNISYPAGPRCTPTIDEDRVYILGSQGDLRCLDINDGSLIWKKSLTADFSAEVPLWGFSAHPLIEGDLLYTMVGGDGQAVVAMDKMTGEVKWKAIDDTAGYCPPSIVDFGGKRQLMVYHPTAVTSLDPTDGSQHWTIPIKPSYEMSINRPMVDGNKMYVSGIQYAAVLIELSGTANDESSDDSITAKEVWRSENNEAVHCANSTPMFVDGIIYGADCNKGSLIAVDANDGTRLWKTFEATRPDEKRFIKHGTCFLTRMGETDRYLIFTELGDLQIAKLTRDQYENLGSFHVLEPTGEAFGRDVVWSHPAYADRTAYIRNDKEIVAVSLAK
ncbi:Outer membrane protein assembly factor BamB precursor [Rubripirellula obstinata]|uniref:Outer membrane protein assembly factor BamB n=1 Tax=Rubripirellula obstinata TaxID=406547 RepID=A0A5B1CRR2_9BACT|nr:PQQ-binding-like beta-propeller repeat protein [Rubripirellula obstinata]KAA1262073.1 Outer membrane protein assembly factor BamB precursor [Rubripirellula obstinata]